MKNIFRNSDYNARSMPCIFENVDYKLIDSMILNMSEEQKISQLLVSDNIYLYDSVKECSGYFYNETDSLFHDIDTTDIFGALKINFGSSGLPYDSAGMKLETIEILNIIDNDSLRDTYINYCARELSRKSFHINILSAADSSSHIKGQSLYLSFSESNTVFFQNRILLAYSDDFINLPENEAQEILENGLSCVFISEGKNTDKKLSFLKKNNFNGIIISNLANLQEKDLSDTIVNLLNAGSDLIVVKDIESAKTSIKEALQKNKISKTLLNLSVRRVMTLKYRLNTLEKNEDNDENKAELVFRKLYKHSISIINNFEELLPLKGANPRNILVVTAGKSNLPDFQKSLKNYCYFKHKHFDQTTDLNEMLENKADLIIYAFDDKSFDKEFFKKIKNKSKSIIVNFGNNSNIDNIPDSLNFIQVLGNSAIEQKYAGEIIFGGIAAQENILFTKNKILSKVYKKTRISYGIPEDAGLDSDVLSKIDSIVYNSIINGVFPGAQILVIKNGIVVYNESKGYHTYSKTRPVYSSDLYDLASITKIAATTLATMKMYDEGRLRLDDELKKFFRNTKIDYSNLKADTIINIDTLNIHEVKNIKKILQTQDTLMLNDSMFIAFDTIIVTSTPNNNIFKVKIRELLLHKSGITPVLPILPFILYKKSVYEQINIIKQKKNDTVQAINDSVLLNRFDIKHLLDEKFNTYYSKRYIKDSSEIKIADNFYLKNNYFDTLWNNTKRLRVYSRKIYTYSDINMILLQMAIDSLNRRGINEYLSAKIYKPLNLNTIRYTPLRTLSKDRIAPTEDDRYWREQLVHGNVHDPSAAVLGGVSGNAGLFSNSIDLGILGQMLLNNGEYGGVRIFKPSTVKLFTTTQDDSSRGLGFDKASKKSITGKGVPYETYGHTGFTGTCIWIDPVNDIVYVFLSNRVYPNAKNWRISTYKTRQNIQTVIYESFKK